MPHFPEIHDAGKEVARRADVPSQTPEAKLCTCHFSLHDFAKRQLRAVKDLLRSITSLWFGAQRGPELTSQVIEHVVTGLNTGASGHELLGDILHRFQQRVGLFSRKVARQ